MIIPVLLAYLCTLTLTIAFVSVESSLGIVLLVLTTCVAIGSLFTYARKERNERNEELDDAATS